MKKNINAVIFDQDGLMFDTERISATAWSLAGQEMGVMVREEFLCTIRGMNFKDAEKRFQEEFGEGTDWQQLRSRKWEIFRSLRTQAPLPVKPGLYELLDYLQNEGYKIAMATASTMDYSRENLEETGIFQYFRHITTGDQIAHAKPNPEIFLKTAWKLKENPENCLVLEDSLNGVEAGILGGFATIMVPDLTMPTKEISSRLTKVCDSLLEVRDWLAEQRA